MTNNNLINLTNNYETICSKLDLLINNIKKNNIEIKKNCILGKKLNDKLDKLETSADDLSNTIDNLKIIANINLIKKIIICTYIFGITVLLTLNYSH